jgi:DNA replication protein DnaC
VTAESNRYSVPSRYVGRDAIVEIYENTVAVLVGDQRVAEHRCGRGKHEFILAFEQWTQIFPDAMAAHAGIDRLIHHGSVLE